ncbi:MAG: DUF2267 domain-containing protein [Cyanophyceae cyanobacterium]
MPLLEDNQDKQPNKPVNYQDFLESVQTLDFISDRDTADAAIKAVLGHIASRVEEAIARQFIEQLPDPLSFETLRGHQETVTEISAEQFLVDLAKQFNISQEQAARLVRQVVQAAKEVSGSDFSRLETYLPPGWTEMMNG